MVGTVRVKLGIVLPGVTNHREKEKLNVLDYDRKDRSRRIGRAQLELRNSTFGLIDDFRLQASSENREKKRDFC